MGGKLANFRLQENITRTKMVKKNLLLGLKIDILQFEGYKKRTNQYFLYIYKKKSRTNK